MTQRTLSTRTAMAQAFVDAQQKVTLGKLRNLETLALEAQASVQRLIAAKVALGEILDEVHSRCDDTRYREFIAAHGITPKQARALRSLAGKTSDTSDE